MRYNKIFLVTLFAVVATMLQSCLKDQEDIFDETGAVRSQEYLDNAKKVLTSSEYGWAFDYYPDRDISYGGYVYTVKFDGSEVTAMFELMPGETETSLYRLCEDNGPTLSFDSYSDMLHFFSTPNGSNPGYQAYDGDFEFMIMEVSDDLIKLRGKRTGNTMYLRRLTEPAPDYMTGVIEMADNLFLTAASGTIGSADAAATFDLDVRRIDILCGNESEGSYFVPGKNCIIFMDPVVINGAEITRLDFDAEKMVYSGTDSKGNAITLAGTLPDTYEFFDDLAGDYTINYNGSRKINITLQPDKPNNCYIIKGLNSNYDVIAKYSKSRGCLEINSQQVAVDGNKLIWFCAWGLDPAVGSGSITWATEAGCYLVKDVEHPGTYNFVSNNYDNNVFWTSFAAYYFTNTVGGQPRGQADSKWRFTSTTGSRGQLTYCTTMVKR